MFASAVFCRNRQGRIDLFLPVLCMPEPQGSVSSKKKAA